jgi:hypothetical protein
MFLQFPDAPAYVPKGIHPLTVNVAPVPLQLQTVVQQLPHGQLAASKFIELPQLPVVLKGCVAIFELHGKLAHALHKVRQ